MVHKKICKQLLLSISQTGRLCCFSHSSFICPQARVITKPNLPDLCDVPDLPDLSGVPEVSESTLPDLPDLPGVPEVSEGTLPDLPDLSDVPEVSVGSLPGKHEVEGCNDRHCHQGQSPDS